MRGGAAWGTLGNFHELGWHRCDEEFEALVVPFVEGAIANGEPVVVACDARKGALVRSWASDPSRLALVDPSTLYSTPAKAIAWTRRFCESRLAEGATQIRIAGEVPHPGIARPLAGWDRYEWALNSIFGELPVWTRCLYDARLTTEPFLEALQRSHPYLVAPSGGRAASPTFEAARPPSFAVRDDPLERGVPIAETLDATPAEVRRMLEKISQGRLSPALLDDLLIGASEAVANALRHGRRPTTVRIWADDGKVIVHVHDRGTGPRSPTVGLSPVGDTMSGGGLGLWITHQLDLAVDLVQEPLGFTVKLRAGTS